MSRERIVAAPQEITRLEPKRLPRVIAEAGERAEEPFFDFFTANIRNPNTRRAYMCAAADFLMWCEAQGFSLTQIRAAAVSAYTEQITRAYAAPTVKQRLAAIRMLFDWLITGGVLEVNPAASVRGPKHVVKRGKTPVLSADQVRTLIDSIDTRTIAGLRDRALIGVMVFSFARVGAVVAMRVEDYFQNGKRWWFRLHEKGSKRHEVPAHHKAEEYIDPYLAASGIWEDKKSPLFRTVNKGAC